LNELEISADYAIVDLARFTPLVSLHKTKLVLEKGEETVWANLAAFVQGISLDRWLFRKPQLEPPNFSEVTKSVKVDIGWLRCDVTLL
jgi:hypothetical protein